VILDLNLVKTLPLPDDLDEYISAVKGVYKV
jgi:hypothetical protein